METAAGAGRVQANAMVPFTLRGQQCSGSRRWQPPGLLTLTNIKQSFDAVTGMGPNGSYAAYS